MAVSPPDVRQVWLRRSTSPHFTAHGSWYDLSLSEIGNAAARETLATATHHFAAIWVNLFEKMLVPRESLLRWLGKGPGVGRDARIAYSGLIGRYVARAYLTGEEGVRVLIALDEAKSLFERTPYSIKKNPPGKGLEADWIGLDDRGLVIVEAKGCSDKGVRTWHGQHSTPRVLNAAIGQAERTAVFKDQCTNPLPVRRWAVASRWANEDNYRLDPTLLAWNLGEEELDREDYRELAKIFLRADLDNVLTGLGHSTVDTLDISNLPIRRKRISGYLKLRLKLRGGEREQDLEPGFAALVGPFGLFALHSKEDLDRVRLIRELFPNVALVSLSSEYISTIANTINQGLDWLDDASAFPHSGPDDRFVSQAGLTVVWLKADEEIDSLED